jgi:hypothetical protein
MYNMGLSFLFFASMNHGRAGVTFWGEKLDYQIPRKTNLSRRPVGSSRNVLPFFIIPIAYIKLVLLDGGTEDIRMS